MSTYWNLEIRTAGNGWIVLPTNTCHNGSGYPMATAEVRVFNAFADMMAFIEKAMPLPAPPNPTKDGG